jgi:ribonuclease E
MRAEQPEQEDSAPSGDRKRRRRRGKRSDAGAGVPTEEAAVEPDSSPMVERPVEQEPPIAEVEAPAEPEPKRRRSRAKAKPAEAVEVVEAVVVEPAPQAETVPPAETTEAAEEPKPGKPARKSRSRKAKDEVPAVEPKAEADASGPTADNDEADDGSGEGPRRGWWQRTFG